MSGDYSRQRFDPRRDLAAVLMQQGRVQLDSDWNELVEIIERRLRTETVDLVSYGDDPNHAGVTVVPRQTPDGFRINATAGDLSIGRGRAYVDGLLVENHGRGTPVFDATLNEIHGSDPLSYAEQPYFPAPPALPQNPGPHLAYLEVWQRELTHLVAPGLVEPAIGVDTTTRWQTVWQVRVLADIGNASCGSDDGAVPGWADLTRPSAGRLSTAAVGVPPALDPCELPPSGGYRGLENQLYRVEIHEGGGTTQANRAWFKWSRDNASVASAVEEVLGPNELRFASLGRDAVLGFAVGDWIEVLDDRRELSGEGGDPARRRGVMTRITDIDEARRRVSVDPALPAELVLNAADAASRHLRATRWDQKGTVRDGNGNVLVDLDAPGSTGLIPLPASGTPILLENGVQITFTLPAGGRVRSGDFWVFAARTADASVEVLDQAPPRGIHRHYARLSVVTFPGSETDCRRLWPPEFTGEESCCCTVCVTPESHRDGLLTLQQAVDQVKATGGTVCLAAGLYTLSETLRIDDARSLTITGQGWSTILLGANQLIAAQGAIGLTLEQFSLLGVGTSQAPHIGLRNCIDARLLDLVVLGRAFGDFTPAAIGLSGIQLGTEIARNFVLAQTGVALARAGDEADFLLSGILRIEDNVFWCQRYAVRFQQMSLHLGETRLAGNSVFGCRNAGFALTGITAPGYGARITGNTLRVQGEGIVAGLDGSRIEGNELAGFAEGQGGAGIVLAPGLDPVGLDHVWVLANRITRLQGAGVAIRVRLNSAMIKQNFIEDTAGGIHFEPGGSAVHLAIDNNQLLAIRAAGSGDRLQAVALRLANVAQAGIIGNLIDGVGTTALQGEAPVALMALGCGALQLTANALSNIGPIQGQPALRGLGAGIELITPFDEASVTDNRVREQQQGTGLIPFSALLAGETEAQRLREFAGNFRLMRLESRAVLVAGTKTTVVEFGRESLGARGNSLFATNDFPLLFGQLRGEAVVADNRCVRNRRGERAVVRLAGTRLSVSANHVDGAGSARAMEFNGALARRPQVSVLGNVADGDILVNGQSLGEPWRSLNILP